MYWRKKRFDVIPEKQRHRSEWQDWNYEAELYAFGHRLGEPLPNQALTKMFTFEDWVKHEVWKHEQLDLENVPISLEHNKDLILKGKELAEKFIKRYLRYFLKKVPEECIETVTDYLLFESTLANTAKWIGCIDLIRCTEFPPSEKTLSQTVLSLIGTIATEYNEKQAQNFITDFVLTNLNGADILEIWNIEVLGLSLNRYLRNKNLPEYEPRIMFQSAVGTLEACYLVGLYVDQKLIGHSGGESPAIAKHMAEMDAFRNIFDLGLDRVVFKFGQEAHELNLGDKNQLDKEYFSIYDFVSSTETNEKRTQNKSVG